MQNPLSRSQREGLRPSDCYAGHGGTQVGRILAYEEALRVQVRLFTHSHSSRLRVDTDMASSGCKAHEEQVSVVFWDPRVTLGYTLE